MISPHSRTTLPPRRKLTLAATAILLASLGWTALSCSSPPPPSSQDAEQQASDADPDANAATPTPESLAASALAAANSITQSFLMDRVNVLASDDFGGRDNLSPGGVAARDWLAADLANLGLAPVPGASPTQPFKAGVNLCVRVPGSDPALAKEHVVVGAHYDHLGTVGAPNSQCKPGKSGPAGDSICNGAADNASGVAVAVAVLNVLAKSQHRPRRSLVLCLFDAEEDGLLGSRHFVSTDPLVPLSSIAAMLSIDNVGTEFLPGEPSSFATDAEFSAGLRAAVKSANAISGMQTWPVSSFFVGQAGGGRSDHLPFREAGIPVLFIGSGSSPEYHSTADEPGILNAQKLLQIARHTTVLVALVANADNRPDFITEPAPHLDDARALISLADRVISSPGALGMSPAQVDLVKGWRTDLQGWVATPPATKADWDTYQGLVKAILAAVYLFAG